MKLYEKTIHELSSMLRAGEITSVELTQSVLDRIEEVDGKVNGYITVDREGALAQAAEADAKLASGEPVPELCGIPVAIKDNICTKGLATTCASKMLENFVPPYDAFVIDRIKKEGGVIIGKTNMDEFAMGASNETSYFGIARNPYNLDKIPGGSSGGSAVAVSADEAICALGSDTGGSIRQPASFCSIVGLKPTYGLVSRYGLVAFASSLDQIGPMTKDVTDCAILLNAIAGHDDMDSTSASVEIPDYKKSLVSDVKGLKIGIPTEYLAEGISADVKEAVLSAAGKFEELGATVEYFNLPMTDHAVSAYYIISSAEASSNLARFDGIKYGYRAEKFDDLTDLFSASRSEGFGSEVKRRIMLGTYVLSSGYYDAYYKKAQQVRTVIRKAFDDAFDKYDVILSPTTTETAFDIGGKVKDSVSMYLNDIYTVSVNIAGLPAMVVPAGFGDGNMPIGIQLIGRHFDESTLIRAAYTFEQNTDFSTVRPEL